jgi:hypothetical protein
VNTQDFPGLQALRDAWLEEEVKQGAEDQAWWDSLTMEARAQAFRQVCRLLYKADVEHKGSYRYAVYDIFNVDYIDGMNHYMALHNLINKALSSSQESRVLDS